MVSQQSTQRYSSFLIHVICCLNIVFFLTTLNAYIVLVFSYSETTAYDEDKYTGGDLRLPTWFNQTNSDSISVSVSSSTGEGNGTPLRYSCLENPMDGGAWQAVVHGVAESWTQLSDFTLTFHFHALEKEMATHSSVLAWRIPGTREPGRLPSMGSHRVEHN